MERNLDEQLRLILACCDPELDADDQVGLVLHEVCGLTYEQVARAFLVSTMTMARRLLAAKAILARNRRRCSAEDPWQDRLAGGMAALYLLFSEGYAATSGDRHVRPELCARAIRLLRRLRTRFEDPPAELDALLALMLLQHARRKARVDSGGDVVMLADQDPELWEHELVAEGNSLLREALGRAPAGEYALQASIAAVHTAAKDRGSVDWRQIIRLYDRLFALRPSPIIALNRAVAISMSEGPLVALPLVEALKDEIGHEHYWHACRADLLRKLMRTKEAMASYRRALAFANNEAERRFLERRIAELTDR